MIDKINILDQNIVLYKKELNKDIYQNILKLSEVESDYNIWEIPSFSNLSNTKHVYNKNILNLPSGDFLFPENLNNTEIVKSFFNIKNSLTDHVFECMLEYSKHYEIILKKIKNWTVCSSKDETDFHDDLDMDGDKHRFSVLVCINDDFSGGDFLFKDRIGNESIPMSSGDVLIYPSNSNYIHKELQVLSGIKYTAISYFN